uniref:Uncharacterized protein n=1 Tax=Callorhinchus milii TaxID=7868 RepID=A0A4W3H3C4_CALMI
MDVSGLIFPVQRSLDDQLREFGAVPPGFHVEPEQVVGGADRVGFQTEFAGVGIVSAGQRDARPRSRVLRDLDIDLLGGKTWRIIVDVQDLHFNHTQLLVVGKDFQRDHTLGNPFAHRLPVDALLGVHIFRDVPDHSARSLLFQDRVFQILQGQRL